jgi:RNA polymerase sigma-B factor
MRFLARQSDGSATMEEPTGVEMSRPPSDAQTPREGEILHARFGPGHRSRSGAATAVSAPVPGVALHEAMPRTFRCIPTSAGPERVDHDRALFERYLDRRAPEDRKLLVERFLPLARQLARRCQRPEEPFDDLFQVACLGLVKAIDRFDLSRDVAFSSYAVPTILGEIKRYFRDRTWSVRVPRDLQELALRVDRKRTELSTDLHRQPMVGELAAALGLDEERVLEALEASGAYRATSLSLPRSNHDEAGDTLGDTVSTSEDGFGLAEDRAMLDRLLQTLSPRARKVVRLRCEGDLTQAEIGELIGVSQMQVSRILRQSLSHLRTVAEARSSSCPR